MVLFMNLDPIWRRRCLGILVLGGAVGMLIAGLTVLSGTLNGLPFVVYWLVCVLFIGLAMLIAIRDARDLLQRTKAEQRALVETTLKDIETDARLKRHSGRGRKVPGPP
jgi:predicted Co/Zn/Cd cation transporter (cation efflux family)